jgi:hypothetical protein
MSAIVPCVICRERKPDVHLRRVPLLGLRPICEACVKALNAMGYGVRAA